MSTQQVLIEKGSFFVDKERRESGEEKQPFSTPLILFMVLVVVINIVAIISYVYAHPTEGISVQIWNYFESGTGKIVSGGLIVTILVSLVERRYRIMDSVRKNRAELERKRRKQRQEKRWECIDETSEMWNELYGMATEVVYFGNNPSDETTIEDVLQRIRNFSTKGEETVNKWYFRFRDLFQGVGWEDVEPFDTHTLAFVNMLLCSTETVAFSIQDTIRMGGKADTEEIMELQESLRAIQDSINRLAHHRILSILKHYVDLMDGDLSDLEEVKTWETMKAELDQLKYWAEAIATEANQHNRVLLYVEDRLIRVLKKSDEEVKKVETFRESLQQITEWKEAHPHINVNQCEDFGDFCDKFYDMPSDGIFGINRMSYSPEYVKYIAKWLTLESICKPMMTET